MTAPFDFENERNLSNTFSIIETLTTEFESEKTSVTLKNVELSIRHAKAGLEELYDLRAQNREEIFNFLTYKINDAKRVISESTLQNCEDRLVILGTFDEIIKKTFHYFSSNSQRKLKINADKTVVYDLLRQLKNLQVRDEENFLPQNNRQLAEFLVSCIEGFENSNPSTIEKELGREQPIKKRSLLVKTKN